MHHCLDAPPSRALHPAVFHTTRNSSTLGRTIPHEAVGSELQPGLAQTRGSPSCLLPFFLATPRACSGYPTSSAVFKQGVRRSQGTWSSVCSNSAWPCLQDPSPQGHLSEVSELRWSISCVVCNSMWCLGLTLHCVQLGTNHPVPETLYGPQSVLGHCSETRGRLPVWSAPQTNTPVSADTLRG